MIFPLISGKGVNGNERRGGGGEGEGEGVA